MKHQRALVVTLLTTLVASAGCLFPTEPSSPQSFVLAPGESASYGALRVRFVGVTADSRCPANALCIQQGDAAFTVEARVRNVDPASYELLINDTARRRVVHAGYAIEATELAPYPFAIATINPIAPGDYRLTLKLSRQ